VTVSFAPKTSLIANGTDQTTVTATVKDGDGHGVPGENVSFKSSNPDDVIGPVTDDHHGNYTATLLASTIAGTDTITATDSNASKTGTAQIAETPGPPTHIKLTLSPPQIPADGSSQTTVTAVVTDQFGNHQATGGDTIQLASTDSAETIGPVVDHGNGSYTTTITSSTTEGTWTITATDVNHPGISGTASLATTGLPTTIKLTLSPHQIPADGVTTASAVATVTDKAGDPIAGQSVRLTSSDPNQRIGTVTDNNNGTYTATITASTNAGTSTLTATDVTPQKPLAGTAILTETAGPPAALSIALSPARINADGQSTTRATATIVDQFGNPDGAGGDVIVFSSSDPGQRLGSVSDNGNGSYSVTITASTVAGPSSISAIDSTKTPNLTGLTTLIELTPSPATAAPVLGGVRTRHRVFAERRRRGPGHSPKNAMPVGTTLSFTLDQPATVTMSFASRAAGRRARGRCVRPTARNRHSRPCIRLTPAGVLSATGHTGINRIPFDGQLTSGTRLPPGRYTATVLATNAAGLTSQKESVRFTIVDARNGRH
jgi:hypothetical protein